MTLDQRIEKDRMKEKEEICKNCLHGRFKHAIDICWALDSKNTTKCLMSKCKCKEFK